jgi:hypothetical protein
VKGNYSEIPRLLISAVLKTKLEKKKKSRNLLAQPYTYFGTSAIKQY